MQILGHDIKLDIDFSELSEQNQSEIIDNISQSILDGNYEGDDITRLGESYQWNKVEDISYLDEKIAFLENENEVILEHKQKIYEIFLNSNGDYEYNEYDFSDWSNGEELESADGGFYTGSAKEAVYMFTGESL